MRELLSTHGLSRQHRREYTIWKGMKQRCSNPRSPMFKWYGAKGINVCERWAESFPAFLEDMRPAPSDKYSLDRIDSTRGYEPGNVRWATDVEQNRNKPNNHRLAWRGETKSIAEWAEHVGIDPRVIEARINRYKWTTDRALGTPTGRSMKR